MLSMSTITKLLKTKQHLYDVHSHKEFSMLHVFQMFKVLAYTSLLLTTARATARQYQEHLDEKDIKRKSIDDSHDHQLIAHKGKVIDLVALTRSDSSSSINYSENDFPQVNNNSNHNSNNGTFGSFSVSPLNEWIGSTVGRLKSFVGYKIKKERMTISLKNTILWNPSKDIQSPNHAFNKNTVLLLSRLAQIYELHLLLHTNSSAEKKQVCHLLRNAHIVSSDYLKTSGMVEKVYFCTTEQGKMRIIEHIKPFVHVEGGSEMEDGHAIIRQLYGNGSVGKKVWIIPNQNKKLDYQDKFKEDLELEMTDSIIHSSIARNAIFIKR